MKEELIARVVADVLEQLGQPPQMNLKLAQALMERVEEKAREMGIAVVTAVSDASARPVAVHCMDGAYIGSFDIAVNKTFTSVGFQMSTKRLGELSQPGGSLYGIQHTNEGKVVIFGGGEPLYLKGKLIGAIGVSGGSAQQDSDLAAFGVNILKEVVSCL